MPSMSPSSQNNESIKIREVWGDNLESEFALIRDIVDHYPYVAMDTEFPGIVCHAVGEYKSNSDRVYADVKANVDVLKLIQLGLTFSDEAGNIPTCGTGWGCVWQFNFREFDPTFDLYFNKSIELLRNSGIDFGKNAELGVDALRFSELLISSGVVLNDEIHWVTFHSRSDFAYLLKILTCRNLPDTQASFFTYLKIFFPIIYDIKHLMKYCDGLYGGLETLAKCLEVKRVGVCHQAGSDSLLTLSAFMKLKEAYFTGSIEKYAGVLYGLNADS